MNLKTFIANALGGVAVELGHAVGQAFHAKFLEYFEDPDGDDVYTLKGMTVKLRDEDDPLSVSDLAIRVISSMTPKELEFELDTPIHLIDDTDGDGDIEVSLKKGGLFKERSHLRIRLLMDRTDVPEGLQLLRDKTNENLHHDLEG